MYRYNMPVFSALVEISVFIAWICFMGHCIVGLVKYLF